MISKIPFSPLENWIEKLDKWTEIAQPFYLMTDFSTNNTWAGSAQEAVGLGIHFNFNQNSHQSKESQDLKKFPLSKEEYAKKYQVVQEGLNRGDSFLVNLTQETKIELNTTLKEIFQAAQANYKLLVENSLVVFSPEPFIKIENNRISSFPMKGTISADNPENKEILLNDTKENAEHATIVDLIRNDLSKVAFPVKVKKYKYLDKIITNQGNLWQMSSIIEGELQPEFKNKIGSILRELLPAGSISGAPKPKTLELISEAENYERGFYTGIMGYFDGKNFDSGVLIRFIEKRGEQYYFKSGGGITIFSDLNKEYEELIQKIYLPF